MNKKNLISIFLNKHWIINETPKAVAIIAPKNYFTRKKDVKVAIWFSKSTVFNSIKYQNRMIIWIDLDKEYQIITTDKTNKEIAKEVILGNQLYDQIKATIIEIKDNYLANKNNFNQK